MLALLRPGGVLAIQIPMNRQEPIHRILTELVQGKWRAVLSLLRLFHTLTPGEYFDLLAAPPVESTLWQTTCFHLLDARADIRDWYRGTGLLGGTASRFSLRVDGVVCGAWCRGRRWPVSGFL